MATSIQPFLRWAGSKKQLLPKLIPFWCSSHSRYVEPFMGSACFFFALKPTEALLGDVNPDLIRTFRTVRKCPKLVANRLHGLRPGKETYYALRKQRPEALCDTTAAARFIFLNRFCFNGLYRTNLSGEFNVPFAPSGTGGLPSKEHLCECAEVLQSAALQCGDFGSTLRRVRKGDFVYLDPPFAVGTRRVFREYGPRAFNGNDLSRLSRVLKRIDAIGATFVISYADCPEAREIFSPWTMKRVRTRRNIAGFAIHRRHAFELIATNRGRN